MYCSPLVPFPLPPPPPNIPPGGWDRNNAVGKHAGSLLTRKIAADNLADAYMAFNTNYHDTGLFGVYAVTDRDRSQVGLYVFGTRCGEEGWNYARCVCKRLHSKLPLRNEEPAAPQSSVWRVGLGNSRCPGHPPY